MLLMLQKHFQKNLTQLLISSPLVQIFPAAVGAPMYFSGKKSSWCHQSVDSIASSVFSPATPMAQPAVAILSQGSNANVVKPVQPNYQIKLGLNNHNQRKS